MRKMTKRKATKSAGKYSKDRGLYSLSCQKTMEQTETAITNEIISNNIY